MKRLTKIDKCPSFKMPLINVILDPNSVCGYAEEKSQTICVSDSIYSASHP